MAAEVLGQEGPEGGFAVYLLKLKQSVLDVVMFGLNGRGWLFLLPFFLLELFLFVEVAVFLLLLDFLLQGGLVPSADLRQVLSVPFLALVESAGDLVQMPLHFLLAVVLPALDIVQTDGHSHFVVPTRPAYSMPEGIVVLSVEENHQIQLNVDASGQQIRGKDDPGLVYLVHKFYP